MAWRVSEIAPVEGDQQGERIYIVRTWSRVPLSQPARFCPAFIPRAAQADRQ